MKANYDGKKEASYSNTARAFSEASAAYDIKISRNFVNVAIREVELRALIHYSTDKNSILEIGCGTGQEALRFIRATGKRVAAIDISPGMIDFANAKMESHGLKGSFNARVMPARDVALIQEKFDLIYSFNGALNNEPEISNFLTSLAGIAKRDAMFIFSLRNDFCLGETLLLLFSGKRDVLRERRGKEVFVEVGASKIQSRYYSVREITDIVPREFRLIRLVGLAVVLPPYLAEKVRSRYLRILISSLDRILGTLPIFRRMGDETFYVFQKT